MKLKFVVPELVSFCETSFMAIVVVGGVVVTQFAGGFAGSITSHVGLPITITFTSSTSCTSHISM